MSGMLDTFDYDLNRATNNRLESIINPEHPDHASTLEDMCLTSKKVSWKERDYLVVKYDKQRLAPDTVETSGLFRSVIVSLANGKIVSFSPPKSLDFQQYVRSDDAWEQTRVEQFVEGTMINMFNVDGEWELATRSLVGANGKFYNEGGKNTFRSMFLDAVRACGPPSCEEDSFYGLLNPSYCYSFVFQHPDNQIVTAVDTPRLYLIRVYEINGGNVTEYLPSSPEMKDLTYPSIVPLSVESPLQYTNSEKYNSLESLKSFWSSLDHSHDIMGVVLVDASRNVRSKIRNPSFEMVRQLRGNQPKLQYQYLALRKEGKVGQYLRYYKQASDQFFMYREQLHNFTRTLHSNYVDCFVKKTQGLKEYSGQYKPHMYALHNMYLEKLREKKEFVSLSVVINYVNELPTPRLMFSLNWHPRLNAAKERELDQKKMDEPEPTSSEANS